VSRASGGSGAEATSGTPILPVLQRIARRLSSETRGLARDTLVLAIGSVVTMAGYMTQIALVSHLLGLRQYGVLALTISFVEIVNRFFDVQVGDTAIAFGAEKMKTDVRGTAGVFQLGYLIDLAAGLAGFAVVAGLAPFAGSHLVGPEGPRLFMLYGLTLLASTAGTTSFSMLRLFGRFGTILRLTALREALRVGSVSSAIVVFGTLESVVIALVLLEAVIGVLAFVASNRAFAKWASGVRLWGVPVSSSRGIRRRMLAMILQTNFVAYAKIVSAQGPTLLLGVYRPPAEVGAFKIATAIAAAVGKPADPAWAAVLPRLAHLWTARRTAEIRRLIGQATPIAFVGLSLLGAVAIVLRDPLLRLFGGAGAVTATTVLILAVAAQIVNGSLFWNTPLIYSAKRAKAAMIAYVGSSAVLALLLWLLIREWGATGATAALLVFTVQLNVTLTVTALSLVRPRGG